MPLLSRSVATSSAASKRDEINARVGKPIVDLRHWCSPIEDQGNIGSCTAQAVVGALEYFERKTRGKHVEASRLFLYRVTRRYLGWEGKGDTGAFLRSAIKALRLFGTVPESYWPYREEAFDEEPEAFHYVFAQSFKALEYFRVPETVHDLQQVLNAGFPFVFGFTCFESLDGDDVERTGIIPYPRKRERSDGGHAVMAVGYTDSHVIIRNSWGRGWGDRGYGYLPWSYFDGSKRLADDCWVLMNASWMPEDEGEVMPALALAKAKAPAPSMALAARDESEDNLSPQIRVTRGTDPLRNLPLRLVARADARAALVEDPQAERQLFRSAAAVSLYLRKVRLLDSFDWALFGEAVNELYLIAIVWDLSGRAPYVFPATQVSSEASKTYNLGKGETVDFVGDGLGLWPSQPIVGGLYLRLVVMESDEDVKQLGHRIADVHAAVKSSPLPGALAALATAAAVSAPALAAVAAAADVLTTTLASVLQKNDDDLVALFDGTYGAENIVGTRSDRYVQSGAEIELRFVVTEPAAPAKRSKPTKAKVTASPKKNSKKQGGSNGK